MEIYKTRKLFFQWLFIIVSLIFLIRLFYIQVIDKTYQELASNNVIRKIVLYPPRGLIYDRNEKLIVGNILIYDLMVVPLKVKDLDTNTFCNFLDIDKNTFLRRLQRARSYSKYKPSLFLKQISSEAYARFQEHLFKYPGFFTQLRMVRYYPYRNAAHILGDIGEVSRKQIEESNKFYKSGDYIGIGGIEQEYEKFLRGTKGSKLVLVDVHNREQGSFANGSFDNSPILGKNLITTIDIDLQSYGEKLMCNKKGSIIAIEPQTGEILALVSSPSYDPNLLVGRKRGDNFKLLSKDTLKPLFNRAIMAQYPPGSPIKPLMALISLQEGLSPSAVYRCNGGYFMRGLTVGCLSPGVFNLRGAIRNSCNGYFCNTYRKIIDQKRFKKTSESFANWRSYIASFGWGKPLGIDIPNESSGLLPSVALYDKMYGAGRWKSSTTISLAIGQGEFLVTPLQLVNYIVAIANRGYYYTPHLIKHIEENDTLLNTFKIKHHSKIDTNFFSLIIDAMEDVVLRGTARIARIDSISVCGKTGTAENPHGKDHSFFVSFAPKKQSKIAIMTVVENSGYGSTYAAPIASLMIEKYLKGKISTSRLWLEKRMLEINVIN